MSRETEESAVRRVAAIDIGSNSVRLLVADLREGRALPVSSEKITTRLIEGMAGGMLRPEAMDRTLEAALRLADIARARGAEGIFAFGTSALRDGANRSAFLDGALAAGLSVRVLSGEEEAKAAYAGVSPAGRRGVIDIGGGSTELIAGEDGRVNASASAPVGAVRLMQAFSGDTKDPEAILRAAREALFPIWRKVGRFSTEGWTAVGGTASSLAALQIGLYDPKRVEGFRIRREAALRAFYALSALSAEARRALDGLEERRADIIPYGAAILAAFFLLSGVPFAEVSERDNLLGILAENFPPRA